MAFLLSASEIVEQALRKIGAYGINDSAAEPHHLEEGLAWLDLNMAEISGTQTLPWLETASLSMTVVADQQDYDLQSELGSSYPTDGVSFVTHVNHTDANGNVTPLTIVRRDQWERLGDPDESGTPEYVFIDRLTLPTLKVFRVPSTADGTIDVVVQTFTKDFNVNDPDSKRSGQVSTGLRPTWQRWAIYRLAADLGDGTVARVPSEDLVLFENKAGQALLNLLSFENREHDSNANRRVQPWGA